MVDLTLLCSDRFRVLELLEEKEMFDGKEVYSKCSQDEMAELLELSKHSVNNLISELKELNFVENKTKGKYQITKHGYEALEALTKGKKMNKASNYKCASFFAGVGGIDLGFEKFGFETVYANEFDPKEGIHLKAIST